MVDYSNVCKSRTCFNADVSLTNVSESSEQFESRPDASGPLVSVVMATYEKDNLDFLKKAVESVLAQSYSNFEFIIVLNGAVSEAAQEFLDAAVSRDERLRLLELPENKGPGPARNAGIDAARGEFIAITDSDDLSARERIEKQLAFIQENSADLVGSFYRLIDRSGKVTGKKQTPESNDEIRRHLFLFNPICNSSVFARAEVLKNNKYNERYYYGEDYEVWVNLALDGKVLMNQAEYLLDFRVDDDFLKRRCGWGRFRTDLSNKAKAAGVYPALFRPFILAAALCIASLRLLPPGSLAAFYRIRNRMRFGDKD